MQQSSDLPQGSITKIAGKAIVLRGDDVDTDRIIPARFLKCVSFDALGNQVFADDRSELKGSHPFDQTINNGSSILIVNGNFGCGSSREHAPQALMRWGIRAIIGESFAEIFYGNCLAIGILCATLEKNPIESIQKIVTTDPSSYWQIDICKSEVSNQSKTWKLCIEERTHNNLISGEWDATTQLIKNNDQVEKMIKSLPYLNNFTINKINT